MGAGETGERDVTEPPSVLLQRAADLLEERASRTVFCGPWWTSGNEVWTGGDGEALAAKAHTTFTAHWIAMMDPEMAKPLANILRGVAFTLDCHPEYADLERNYIALAKQILRESP